MYKILFVIFFLLLLSGCSDSMEDKLVLEFEDQGWDCSFEVCVLEEGVYIYSYDYMSNIVDYSLIDANEDLSIIVSVEIDLITGEASMNYVQRIPIVLEYNLYGNVFDGEYECLTFDVSRTHCNSDHIDRGYEKVKKVIEDAGYLISELE